MDRRCVIWVFVAMACRTSTEVGPATPQNKPATQPVTELVLAAQRAHDAHFALDYKRPFELTLVGGSPAVALYLDACRSGNKRACWVAMQIAHQDTLVRQPQGAANDVSALWHEAARLVEDNCLAGHHMSCVALPSAEESHGKTFKTAPGAAGRDAGCWDAEPGGCPEADVRKECDAGFARSCQALATVLSFDALSSPTPDALIKESEALRVRAEEVAVAGCRERLIEDCMRAASDKRPEVRLVAAKNWCELGRICSALTDTYLAQGDAVRARDAAERGCQFFADRCAPLAEKYLDGALPEPVPGRGQALLDFVCDSVRRSSGEEAMQRYTPCKRAKLR